MKITKATKTLLAATLACTLLLGSALAAPLAVGANTGAAVGADPVEGRQPVCVYGQVKEISPTKNGSRILLENSNKQDPYQQIYVDISEETMILDAVSGASKSAKDLAKNDSLYAYVGPAMTRSQPPIAHGALILCDIPADFAVPHWAEIKTVSKLADGGVDVLMTGDMILHLTAKTTLSAYLPEQTATLEGLRAGMRLLSWYSIVAPSMPAQASPEKVMVFEAAAAPETGKTVITRGEFMAALYATVQKPVEAKAAPFADVKDNAAINWAYENKVTTGTVGGTFAPDAPLNRAELMVFLLRYASVLDKGPVGSWAVRLSYADAKTVPAWALSAAMWNEITGLVVADGANNICPAAAVTQAEAASALAGLLARK